MNERKNAIRLAILLSLAGCAAAPAREVQSPREKLTELRAAFEIMSDDASSRAVRLELERARSWMTEANAAIEKDADQQSIALLLELSRGQLVLVKSIVERRKAESALARTSEEYRESRESLESIRQDKDEPAKPGEPAEPKRQP